MCTYKGQILNIQRHVNNTERKREDLRTRGKLSICGIKYTKSHTMSLYCIKMILSLNHIFNYNRLFYVMDTGVRWKKYGLLES